MPGTPGSPVDHLQAHGTASGRGCRDGRSGSRALAINLFNLSLRVRPIYSWDEPTVALEAGRMGSGSADNP